MFPAEQFRMFRRRIIMAALLTAICGGAAVSLQLARPSYYVQTEYRVRDALARAGRTTATNSDLIFLAIDRDSVSLDPDLDVERLFASSKTEPAFRGALQLMTKGWPWGRELYALILERLISAGAKVVAFDCLFPEPATGDDAFRAALDRFHDRVVIGSNFVTPDDVDISRMVPSRYDPPAPTLISASDQIDDRVGFTNFFAGENRSVRAAQFRIAFRLRGSSTETYSSLSARVVAKAGRADAVPNDFGGHLFRFTGPPRIGFHPHPIFEIFVPEYWEHNYRSGELLRDKIVVIGAEGRWQGDELMTPFGAMPGAEVHLNALNALLRGEFLKEPSATMTIAIIVFAALAGGGISLFVRSPWLRFIALIALEAAAPLYALWFYNYRSVYLPAVAPLLALNTNILLCFVGDFAFERIEKLRLRSTLKTRDDLTHMIVHDLRSPLSIVTGYVGQLQRIAKGKLGERESKYVAEALRGAQDMRDMITTLLDVGRLEDGQMPLRLENIDIGEIVRDAATRFAPILDRRVLRCDTPPHSMLLQCDADVIRRVVANLISNAIKYTKSDGHIVVGIEQIDDAATIKVSDDGAGIPVDQHKHIFEKFGQIAGGGEHRHSSGIGLAFCRMAVEAHHGRIGVESEPGRGSTFWFALPVTANLKSPEPAAAVATT
jgi:signal transduction histidine kinase